MTHHYFTLGVLALLLSSGLSTADARRPTEHEARPLEPLRLLAKTGGRTSFDGLTSRVIVKFREGTPRPLVEAVLAKRASDSPSSVAIAAEALAVVPTFSRSAEELQTEEACLSAHR